MMLSSLSLAHAQTGELSASALANAAYPVADVPTGRVQLKDGKFEDKAAKISAQLLHAPREVGDIDGDGVADTAVVLDVTSGATKFAFVCVVLNKANQPIVVHCERIDDRIRVTNITFKGGQVIVNYLGRRNGQSPAARPTVRKRKTFLLPAIKPEAPAATNSIVGFICADGKVVSVTYGDKQATLSFDSQVFTLPQIESASGIRYSDGKTEWQSTGNDGVVYDPVAQKVVIADCKVQPPAVPTPMTLPTPITVTETSTATTPPTPLPPTFSGVLTGTVTYLQRIALDPAAVIEVSLNDVSLADAPPTVIVTQTIQALGKQVPIPFELKYDPATIDPNRTYAIGVRITIGGKPRWTNTARIGVLTHGAPATAVDIVVDPVKQ